MKISVITPTTRQEGLQLNFKSLQQQDFSRADWEWIVCSPFDPREVAYLDVDRWVKDQGKREGDVWGHHRACNDLFRAATGELVITFWDLEWIPPTALSHLWNRYLEVKSIINLAGRGYSDESFEQNIWTDPRLNIPFKFGQVDEYASDTCLSAIPKKAWQDVGGFDEEFDRYGGLGDQEFFLRCKKSGYNLYLDTFIFYKQVMHENRFKDGQHDVAKEYYEKCAEQVQQGRRLVLDYA